MSRAADKIRTVLEKRGLRNVQVWYERPRTILKFNGLEFRTGGWLYTAQRKKRPTLLGANLEIALIMAADPNAVKRLLSDVSPIPGADD